MRTARIWRNARNKIAVLKSRSTLSKLIAVGTREYHLKFEIARSQAAANHELAERSQGIVQYRGNAGRRRVATRERRLG